MEYKIGDRVTVRRVDKTSEFYKSGMEHWINQDGILTQVPEKDEPNIVFIKGGLSYYFPPEWYEHAIMISLTDVLNELEGGPWDNVRRRLEERFKKSTV